MPRPALSHPQPGREYTIHGAPVPEKLREAALYLAELHEIMDRLEGVGQTGATLQPHGLAGLAEYLSEYTALLLGRMRTLFGDETRRVAPTASLSSSADIEGEGQVSYKGIRQYT